MTSRRLDGRAIIVMVMLCVVWGVQQTVSKIALNAGVPPVSQALLRSVLAGVGLLVWIGWRGGRSALAALFARDGTFWAGLLIATGFALEFVLLFEGVARSPASRAVILLYTGAFLTALGTHFLVPGDRLRPVNLLGFLLAFGGVAVTIGGGHGESASLVGDLLVLGAAASWAGTTVAIKAIPALIRTSPGKILAIQVLGSIPILLVVTLLRGEPIVPDTTGLAWLALLYQGLGVTFVSYLIWFGLIARYQAGRLAAFSFLTPLFGLIAAAGMLHEPLAPTLLFGLVAVGGGLVLINR